MSWLPALASAVAYVLLTLVIGRDVLRHLSTGVASDAGDPLLTAAILHWNATHLPLTDAWWQFPIFYPARDALAFSEHLLGISVIATPLEWLTGSPLVTYNIVTLLTYPLCALAMYALVFRLTRSAAGAFVAGLAFGFAPYRVAQLSHIQMLASFYAPLALLGLHAYVETGRRRWLALYGAMWMLQGAANGYSLFFFSVLVGLWGLWFVIARRRWRMAAEIVAATLIAVLPLAAVLLTYLRVHAFNGFVRSLDEIREFSADIAAVLCAPKTLSFWGWLRVACGPEGVLFPGAAVFALYVLGVVQVLGFRRHLGTVRPSPRTLGVVALVALTVGLVYAASVVAIALMGPVRLDAGVLHLSITNMRKAAVIAIGALVVAAVLRPASPRSGDWTATLGFYVVAAVVTWLLALGPSPTLMQQPTGLAGPFSWLLRLPGTDSLRVPARFWLMTVICLSVVAGMVVSELLTHRRRATTWVGLVVLSIAVFADGAVGAIGWDPAPAPLPNEAALAGKHVMLVPLLQYFDIPSTYRAAVDGWQSVNGYSGFLPRHYFAVSEAIRAEDPAVFAPFQRYGPLEVIVPQDAPRLRALVEQQPGVVEVARDRSYTQYHLPARPVANTEARGHKLTVSSLSATCSSDTLRRAIDGNLKTAWLCRQKNDEAFTIDLGRIETVGAVVTALGDFTTEYPRHLVVETSADGTSWREAWSGSGLGPLVWSAMQAPTTLRVTMAFAPTAARFIRLRQTGRDPTYQWGIAELEVWSGS